MAIHQVLLWGAGLVLVITRTTMLFIATPVFGAVGLPALPRAVVILGLSMVLLSGASVHVADLTPIHMGAMVLHEVVVGGAIAFGLFSGFGAFHFAGRLLDSQIGYGVAALVDLATKNNSPLLGSLLLTTAVAAFFSMDGHLAMLRVLRMTFDTLPAGTSIDAIDFGALIAQFGTCFFFGLLVASPVVLCLFLVDMGVAFLSRTMPQMNVFVLSMALKVGIGLILLAIALPFAGGALSWVFESIFHGWSALAQ